MGRRVVADGARRRAGARPDEVDVRGADAPRPREVLPPAAVAQAFFTIAAAHAVRMLRGRRRPPGAGVRDAGPRLFNGRAERVRVDGFGRQRRQCAVPAQREDLVQVHGQNPAEACGRRALVAVV